MSKEREPASGALEGALFGHSSTSPLLLRASVSCSCEQFSIVHQWSLYFAVPTQSQNRFQGFVLARMDEASRDCGGAMFSSVFHCVKSVI